MVEKFKPKNDCPKLEEMVIETWYAITINPQMNYRTLKGFKRAVDKIFGKYDNTKLILYAEASPTGRVHGHGKLWVKYIDRTYIMLLQDLVNFGTLVIKEIKEPDVWEDYIKKQYRLFKEEPLKRLEIEDIIKDNEEDKDEIVPETEEDDSIFDMFFQN
jgi:hypothetical protein